MSLKNSSFVTNIFSRYFSTVSNLSNTNRQIPDCGSYICQSRFRSGERYFSDTVKYSNRITCTLIPGDGPGIDLARSLQDIFFAAHVPVTFETIFFSEIERNKSASIDKVVSSVLKNRLCLKGLLNLTSQESNNNVNVKLRRALGLCGKIVHARSFPFLATQHKNVDIILCSEQLNGYNSLIEFQILKNVIGCSKIVSYETYKDVARYIFEYSRKNRRKKISCIHKANIFKYTDGLFLKVGEEISNTFSDIKFEQMIVDNFCRKLVATPNEFDVIFTPNIYDDIVTNIAAGLVGGSEYMTAVSFSKDCSVFEPVSNCTLLKDFFGFSLRSS